MARGGLTGRRPAFRESRRPRFQHVSPSSSSSFFLRLTAKMTTGDWNRQPIWKFRGDSSFQNCFRRCFSWEIFLKHQDSEEFWRFGLCARSIRWVVSNCQNRSSIASPKSNSVYSPQSNSVLRPVRPPRAILVTKTHCPLTFQTENGCHIISISGMSDTKGFGKCHPRLLDLFLTTFPHSRAVSDQPAPRREKKQTHCHKAPLPLSQQSITASQNSGDVSPDHVLLIF